MPKRRAHDRSPTRGFTLVELLVVLALMGLILAVAPPMLSAALPGLELKSAARRTAATLRLAREEAIRAGSDSAVVINVENHTLAISGGRVTRLPERLEVRLLAAAHEMQGESAGAIRFFPDGSSTGGRVMFGYKQSGYQIGVSWLTGRIRIGPWEPQP